MPDEIPKTCATCIHMRPRTDEDKFREGLHVDDKHWCAANDQATRPELCRCGGDDYLSETMLRQSAVSAAAGVQVFRQAEQVLEAIVKAADEGKVVWTKIDAPNGMVAVQGNCDGYQMLTARARIVEENNAICYRGTAVNTTGKGPLMVVLPPATAHYLFRKATT